MSQRNDSANASETRRDQIRVLTVAEGFFQSCILFGCVKLGVFDLIAQGKNSSDQIAAALRTNPETVARLLNAAVVLKLLNSADGTSYYLSDLTASVLVSSAGESYLGDWVK